MIGTKGNGGMVYSPDVCANSENVSHLFQVKYKSVQNLTQPIKELTLSAISTVFQSCFVIDYCTVGSNSIGPTFNLDIVADVIDGLIDFQISDVWWYFA